MRTGDHAPTYVELDEISFHHAVKTRQANDIAYTDISLLRPSPSKPILFPIFEDLSNRASGSASSARADVGAVSAGVSAADDGKERALKGGTWDIVICNPPFFASEAEMKEGREVKVGGVPAVSLRAYSITTLVLRRSTRQGPVCSGRRS
jgi:methyltransferase